MKPPRLYESLLTRVVAPSEREAFLDEMRHGFADEAARRGFARARTWYRRQAIASIGPLLRRRYEQSNADRGGVVRDLRLAFRGITHWPGYACAVIGTMALGSGAVIAVAGVANATLFQQFPYDGVESLVVLRSYDTTRHEPGGVAGPDYFDFRDRMSTVGSLSAAEVFPVTLRLQDDTPRRVDAAFMSVGMFDLLGVAPVAGRGFGDEDGERGAPAVVIVREGFGELRVGEHIFLDGIPHTVVGLAPRSIRFPTPDVALWRPLRIDRNTYNRRARILTVVGRLREDGGIEAARADAERIALQLQGEHPDTNGTRSALLTPLSAVVTEPVRRPLVLLAWAVACVLALAYANAAALMLARATLRRRDVVVRAALGASFRAELRRFVFEAASLSMAGAVVGYVLASLVWSSLPRLAPTVNMVGQPADGRLAVLCLGASALLGVFVGGALGYPLARAGSHEVWRSRGTAGRHVATAHRTLVIGQIVIAVALASGATLLVRSLVALDRSELGIRPEGAVIARIELPGNRYPTGMSRYPVWPEVQHFHRELTERLRATPGIGAVGLGWDHPLASGFRMPYRVVGAERIEDEGRVVIRAVSPDYLRATGMRLEVGRDISTDDRLDSPPVALVNETFVRDALGGDDAVGRRVEVFGRTWEIVGVVSDVASLTIGQPVAPTVFPPLTQMPSEFFTVVVRSRERFADVSSLVLEAVRTLDPELAPYDVMPLTDVVRNDTSAPRFAAALGVTLGAVAVSLAVSGIVALLTLTVRIRRREIGVRVALGASPARIRRDQMRSGLRLAVVGLIVGLPAAFVAARALRGYLYGVDALDVGTYVAVAAAVVAIALMASYQPARQAASLHPMTTLRMDDEG